MNESRPCLHGVAFELRCVPFRTFNSFLQWLQVLMLIPKPVKSDMLCDAQLKLPVGSYPTAFVGYLVL